MDSKLRKLSDATQTAVQDVLYDNLKKTILDCIVTGSSLILCGPNIDPQLHSLPGKAMMGISGDVKVVKLSNDICDILMNKEIALSSNSSPALDGSDRGDGDEGIQFQKIIVQDPLAKPLGTMDGSESCVCTHCSTVFSRMCPVFKHPVKKKDLSRAVMMRRQGRLFPSDVKRSQKVPCKYCGKLVSNRSIKYHLESHEGKTYPCQHCQKVFETPFCRNRHEKIHTRSGGDFPCPHCSKRYDTQEAFRVHFNVKHKSERRYFCDICNKGFYFANQLERHRKVHTGEQPYVCNVCGRGFRLKHGLKQHMKQHDSIKTQLGTG